MVHFSDLSLVEISNLCNFFKNLHNLFILTLSEKSDWDWWDVPKIFIHPSHFSCIYTYNQTWNILIIMDQVSFSLTPSASQGSVVLCCYLLLLVWQSYPGAPNKPQPPVQGSMQLQREDGRRSFPPWVCRAAQRPAGWQDTRKSLIHFREIWCFERKCNKWVLIREIFNVAEA